MKIIGAGYSGLLAGYILKNSEVIEMSTRAECINKHQAVFRMRSDKIAEYLGIDFKKIKIYKSIWHEGEMKLPNPRFMHLYSKKVSGRITNRSISDLSTSVRYIPPDNFYELLLDMNNNVTFDKYASPFSDTDENKISTIPLKVIMEKLSKEKKELGFPGKLFNHNKIFVNRFKIKNCDSYCTVYYPSQDTSVYRATLNKDILIVESLKELNNIGYLNEQISMVFESLGLKHNTDCESQLCVNHPQIFGKITEVDNNWRKTMLRMLTSEYNIYSLGRYATWRPKLMLDDVFDDIFVIRKLMKQSDYANTLFYKD